MTDGTMIDEGRVYEVRKSTRGLIALVCLLGVVFCGRSSVGAHENDQRFSKLDLTLAPVNPAVGKNQVIPYRSPKLALALSLGTTVTLLGLGYYFAENSADFPNIGFGMIFAGVVFGPSAGHMYTGDWRRVAGWSAGRLGAALIGVRGFFMAVSAEPGWCCDDRDFAQTTARIVIGVGVVAWAVLSTWEMVDTYQSAKRFNESIATQFHVSPYLIPSAPGHGGQSSLAAGLVFSGTM